MINQQSSQVQTNQYGFYAVPKAVEPKRKYRQKDQEYEEQYSEEDIQDDIKYQTIDREPVNQKQIDRDYYVDEAPFPEFKPKQRGLDYGVQVQRGDLFDYQMEVKPLLQVLVGRSIVQAVNQLQQEKEIKQKAQALDKYQKKRNAQLMVTQRMQAKSKRKQQQSDRRKLQKELYVKNKKQAQKKILARKNAKQALLGIKDELFDELDEQGFLRDTTISSLQINYQGWLYQTVTGFLNEQKAICQQIDEMRDADKKKMKKQHEKNIQKEKKRQQNILNERDRKRKEMEERKRKKRIRKIKLQLKQQRQPFAEKLSENLGKHDPPKGKILASSSQVKNGLTKNACDRPSIYISGGLLNFLLAMLDSSQSKFSAEQVEKIIQKLLQQSQGSINVNLSPNNIEKWQEVVKKLEEDGINFMKNKQNEVNELLNFLSLDLEFIQGMGVSINSDLHQNVLKAVLNIYLTVLPQQKDGESYQPSDSDKKRQSLKQKLQITAAQSELAAACTVQSILRVHFQLIAPQKQEQQQKKQQAGQDGQKKVDLDEWINIYNGQVWSKKLNEGKFTPCKRQEQSATSYPLIGFPNSYVYDQRNLYYLRQQLQDLFEIKAGDRLDRYVEAMNNISVRVNTKQQQHQEVPKGIPVYDEELQWEN